jgi:hypothetical protein
MPRPSSTSTTSVMMTPKMKARISPPQILISGAVG